MKVPPARTLIPPVAFLRHPHATAQLMGVWSSSHTLVTDVGRTAPPFLFVITSGHSRATSSSVGSIALFSERRQVAAQERGRIVRRQFGISRLVSTGDPCFAVMMTSIECERPSFFSSATKVHIH